MGHRCVHLKKFFLKATFCLQLDGQSKALSSFKILRWPTFLRSWTQPRDWLLLAERGQRSSHTHTFCQGALRKFPHHQHGVYYTLNYRIFIYVSVKKKKKSIQLISPSEDWPSGEHTHLKKKKKKSILVDLTSLRNLVIPLKSSHRDRYKYAKIKPWIQAVDWMIGGRGRGHDIIRKVTRWGNNWPGEMCGDENVERY